MTVFINLEKKQLFAIWLKDDEFNEDSVTLTKWRNEGWIPMLTNIRLAWSQLMPTFTKLSRNERVKLEKELFGK